MAKENINSINWTTVSVVLIIVLGFLLAIYHLYPSSSSERTISSTGSAKISVQPDRVVVYAQVLTRSPNSAEEAKNLNAQLYDAILTALIKSGVDRSNIETRGFSIYPEYNWIENQGLILKGYVVTNSFKVSISNINEAGKIVDAIVDNGGLIDSIIYELSDEKLNKYKSEVLSAASKDARIKAEATLKGLGKELGDIISVSTLEYNFIPYPIFRGSDGVPAKESITNLPPANLEVSASVSVTYKIK